MTVEHLAIVLHHSRAKGTEKVILLGIANHDGDHGAFPGIPTLAKYANVSESSAREAVRRLEKLGEVAVHVGAGPLMPNGGRTNRYEIKVACPPECDRTPYHRIRKPSTPTGPPVGVDNSDPHRPTGATPHRPTGATPHRPTGGEPSKNHQRTTPLPPEVPKIPEAVARLWGGEGIAEEEQTELWAMLVADPETAVPARRAIQPAYYVPALAKIRATRAHATGTAVAQIRRWGAECEHGEAGGAEPNPATGLPLCPLCRRKAVS